MDQMTLKYKLKKKDYPELWTQPYFPEDKSELSETAARSSIWVFSGTLISRAVQIFVTAILARILFPEDFGIVGMAGMIIGVVGLFGNFGFGDAIVYKKHVNQIYLSTAFWFKIASSIALCFVCILLSPLSKIFLKNQHLPDVVAVMSIFFIIDSLGGVNQFILTKKIWFDKIAMTGFFSMVIGRASALISIILFQAGFWGLVIGKFSNSVAATAFRYIFTRWRPSFVFDIGALKDMFRYGKNLFFNGFVNYLQANIDYFIVGGRLGMENLGLYMFAYTIPHVVLKEFSQVLVRILFPILCKVNDDHERFNRGYLKTVRLISIISFPTCMGMMSVGNHFIPVLYGDRWLPAIIPFQILCFSGLSKSILTTMGSIFKAKGRPDIELKWNAIFFPIITISVFIGSYFELIGVAFAMTLTSYFSFITMWVCLRLAGIKFRSFLYALAPTFLGSALMSLIVIYLNFYVLSKFGLSHLASLIILTLIGIIIYGIYVLSFCRANILELIHFIKGGIKK